MAVLLVHKSMSGEPIGVFNDEGQAFYFPGYEDEEAGARVTVEERGWGVPWSAYVRRLTETTNFEEWWDSVDTTSDLDAALDDLRDTYFSRRSSATPHDK